jgi:hypothetical protein
MKTISGHAATPRKFGSPIFDARLPRAEVISHILDYPPTIPDMLQSGLGVNKAEEFSGEGSLDALWPLRRQLLCQLIAVAKSFNSVTNIRD